MLKFVIVCVEKEAVGRLAPVAKLLTRILAFLFSWKKKKKSSTSTQNASPAFVAYISSYLNKMEAPFRFLFDILHEPPTSPCSAATKKNNMLKIAVRSGAKKRQIKQI